MDKEAEKIKFKSSRFGELEVPADSLIEFPSGLIGFPSRKNFVLLEHKPPFSWLHSIDDPNLAFVVVDGFEFGSNFNVSPPIGESDADFKEEDEFAILVVVTIRPNPADTTANLKGPLFVNLRNRKGIQVIFDDQRFSTRHPLWANEEEPEDSDTESKGDETENK